MKKMIKAFMRDGIPYMGIRAYQTVPGLRWLGGKIAYGSTSQTALRAISEGMPGWRAVSTFGRVTGALPAVAVNLIGIGEPGSVSWSTLGVYGSDQPAPPYWGTSLSRYADVPDWGASAGTGDGTGSWAHLSAGGVDWTDHSDRF